MENKEIKNFGDLLEIRPTNEEGNDYVITFGNHLATMEHFKSRTAAAKRIKQTDWNLVACVCQAFIDANEKMKQDKIAKEMEEQRHG
ncbi:hypothetical protein [Peromfec virus RodF8_19]|uniref:Uncharacterized protein n=1 Tax=Peromfec virus RodF8_19 TaxID=2929361 RepID=A0A976N2K9_9VIRU|nr:hypothetical protein [Peromfec virus RodF8_19]